MSIDLRAAQGYDLLILHSGKTGDLSVDGSMAMPGIADVDFEAAANRLRYLSDQLAKKPPSGSAAVDADTLTLRGDAGGENSFCVDAANAAFSGRPLGDLAAIDIEIPAGASAVIHVRGSQIGLRCAAIYINGAPAAPDSAQRILWNFPDASFLSLSGAPLFGSLLAPYAAVTGSGEIWGTVIVKTISGRLRIHPVPPAQVQSPKPEEVSPPESPVPVPAPAAEAQAAQPAPQAPHAAPAEERPPKKSAKPAPSAPRGTPPPPQRALWAGRPTRVNVVVESDAAPCAVCGEYRRCRCDFRHPFRT